MAYEYSDPKREVDPYALPDVEVFEVWEKGEPVLSEEGEPLESGWYWVAGFPGCLWDGEPEGPYATEEEALRAAREE